MRKKELEKGGGRIRTRRRKHSKREEEELQKGGGRIRKMGKNLKSQDEKL